MRNIKSTAFAPVDMLHCKTSWSYLDLEASLADLCYKTAETLSVLFGVNRWCSDAFTSLREIGITPQETVKVRAQTRTRKRKALIRTMISMSSQCRRRWSEDTVHCTFWICDVNVNGCTWAIWRCRTMHGKLSTLHCWKAVSLPNLNRRLRRGDSDFQDGYPADGVQKAGPLSSDSIDQRSRDNASQCKSHNCVHSIIHYNYIYTCVHTIYTHACYIYSYIHNIFILIITFCIYLSRESESTVYCTWYRLVYWMWVFQSLSLSVWLIKACMSVAYLPITYITM